MGNACCIFKRSESNFANLPFLSYKHQSVQPTVKDNDAKAKCFVKVLLLGTGDSGKSTIIKQMKILHLNGFSEKEKKMFTHAIRTNLIETMVALVEGMDKLGIFFESNVSIFGGLKNSQGIFNNIKMYF